MKRLLLLFVVMVMVIGLSAQAHALTLTPSSTPVFTTTDNTMPSASDIEALVGTSIALTMLYKGESDPFQEEGSFMDSYHTTFSNSDTDPQNALIEYISGPSIVCPECYLTVKDGVVGDPALYAFDISGWNGTDDIELLGFWPGQGAISNVAIWGGSTSQVPEPSTLILLGSGLVSLGFVRRRFKK
jgi:hypothetical protein